MATAIALVAGSVLAVSAGAAGPADAGATAAAKVPRVKAQQWLYPGTPVILYTCNGGANQQWEHQSDGSFVGGQSGPCLDVTGGAVPAPNGTRLELWQCTGRSNQIWTAV
ncbi:RICIN domain-containing protein [Kitasatospora sp. NPDC093102]|uniref:RICIN domain-containing protein n=1 Tax=Kitasatospora sp. NPDC093102 TaxID=3155069 RepID=UPI003446CE31